LSMHLYTERPGRVVDTPVSYYGGPLFKSRPCRPPVLIEVFVVFLCPSRKIPGKYLKIRPRPLPTKSFPVYHHHLLIALSSTLFILVAEKRRKINFQPTRINLCVLYDSLLHTCDIKLCLLEECDAPLALRLQ
jgi:hypothetical protein